MSEIDILLNEYKGCEEDRNIAEDTMRNCQTRMNEIKEELELLGFNKELEDLED